MAEEEEIQKNMLKSGFKWQKNQTDIVIINTCAVTDKAEREARQLIYKIKRENEKAILVATGCAVTNWQKNKSWKNLALDLAVNNKEKSQLAKLVKERFFAQRKGLPLRQLADRNDIPHKFDQSGRRLIKIQDGCSRFCTYCIVPYLRGLPKSEKISYLLKQINSLPTNIYEVILTAVNTEAFGKHTQENFLDLIKKILEKTSIKRLSFGSIHPWSIDQEFVHFYQKEVEKRNNLANRLVDFFHIPIQSGSDKILSLMKRGYQKTEILGKLKALKKINPDLFIGTDIIVGFLGETDEEFQKTYEFLKNLPVDKIHAFPFSLKKGTAANFLKKSYLEPDAKTKKKRAALIRNLSERKFNDFQKSLVGKKFSCLILPFSPNSLKQGLLSNQIKVNLVKTKSKGGIVEVIVNDFKDKQLWVEVLTE